VGFFENLNSFGDKTALVCGSGDSGERSLLTYSQLAKDADGIAHAVGGRCLVFLVCENSIPSVAGYVGFLRGGIVPVLINSGIDNALMMYLLSAYRPAYCYLPSNQAGDMVSGECVYEYDTYSLIKTDYECDYELSDELALLLTTSGSTGSPKLVRQSYKNIAANTASIIEYLEINEDDRAITTLPMSYTYGLSILNTHLMSGATMLLTDATLMDKSFWALMKEERATTFGGVPYIYEMLKKLRFARMELPSLRYLTQAGGKLSKELAEEFNEICRNKGIKLIVMYGQTEATARMSYLPWEMADKKAGSMGVAIPRGKFGLIDENGNTIDTPDTVGELVYEGDNVTLGYAETRHDLCRGDDFGGRLVTGDMAKRDADGFYYIVGRKKRFLKLFGNRVNLDELEGLLKKQGFVCACAGVDDKLTIFLTDSTQEADITSFVINHTGISRGGFKTKLIDEIPRNEAGKVLYSALADMLG
jgi:acyl-coenzyme A synthetase/AMP-(fatty) acid ligase